ncbi:sulfotransferase domain-containing protein [Okeania sp. SIO2B3]|uniref:sulfotransferase domain-containing protein n=1 Tax=Okeania sp. SIO2B3 TaxID=2607784 RepID=UPI0013C1B5CC|nr:sulfotransferase domain-containing protein [Okeania sp. SIO2B3]NET43629.1 sulfotransferase [Okeania sp. SIO2B3]
MNNRLPIFVHIGLAKTGTTFLQRYFFSRHSEIGYLGKVWSDNKRMLKAGDAIVRRDSISFNLEEVYEAYFEAITQMSNEKKVLVLSEEDFSTYKFMDPYICAMRLTQIFRNVKILITLRHPLDWIESTYFWRLNLEHPNTFNGFESWLKKQWRSPALFNEITEIRYGKIIKLYSEIFGSENIHILLYEEFKEDINNFAKNLSITLGISKEESLTLIGDTSKIKREKNRITTRLVDFLYCQKFLMANDLKSYKEAMNSYIDMLPSEDHKSMNLKLDSVLETGSNNLDNWKEFIKDIRHNLREYFQEGERASTLYPDYLKKSISNYCISQNQILEKEYNLNLEAYGYPMG